MKHLSWKLMMIVQIVILFATVIFTLKWQNGIPSYPEIHDEITYYNEDNQNSRQNIATIGSEEEWLSFSEEIAAGKDYSDYMVVLTADLDFAGYTIEPAGSYENPFRGGFDGGGHTISNVSLISDENYVGLFSVAQYAEIKNLVMNSCDIQSNDAIGTGGIVGLADNCEVTKCMFEGHVYGQEGSVGGIVGNNWSVITDCNVYGAVIGSTQNGSYSLKWQSNSFGTGGIAGDNGNLIRSCDNYANVSDDTDVHESNTSRSGGISGCNSGIIDSCSNYGSVTGGGITENNGKYGHIRYCFNVGDAYSGIALGSYQESMIEYCVNLGNTSGRYAGDIVSFWGQDSEDNVNGIISHCLYVDSSGSGVARHHSFGTASLKDNAKIKIIANDKRTDFDKLIDNKKYYESYSFLLNLEKNRRKAVSLVIIGAVLLGIIFSNGLIMIKKCLKKDSTYKKGVGYFNNKEYWDSYRLLRSVPEYKDAEHIIKNSLGMIFNRSADREIIQFGMHHDEKLYWIKIVDKNGKTCFISTRAIFVSAINDDPEKKQWEVSRLYTELNFSYKQLWFGQEIDRYLNIEITLPQANEILEIFPTNEQRRCKGLQKMSGALKSGSNVYWWLVDAQATGRMPFVTAEGLISERGKPITASNIAVRPMIILKEVL